MDDWTEREAEYKRGIAEWARVLPELRDAYRSMDWWPEFDNSRQRLEETQAYRDFKGKLEAFAETGESERIRASSFWNDHMPKEYSKPEWYAPVNVEASVFDAAVERKAREKAAEVAAGVQPPDRDALLSLVRDGVAELRAKLERRYDGISEDSYASRMEARQDLSFVYEFQRAIAQVKPGGEVDLRRAEVNYGYDAEEAYSDRSVGLPYIPQIEREKSQYESDLRRVQPFMDTLKEAGVKVTRGFLQVWHEDYDSRILGGDTESIIRHLELKESFPELIDIQYDVGLRRMRLEEQFDRVVHDEGTTFTKAERDSSFIGRFEYAIVNLPPGEMIDLRVVGVHEGHNYDLATLRLPKELPVVHADEYSKSEYLDRVASIEKYIHRLERVGVTVRTGYRDVLARDYAQEVRVEQSVVGRDQTDRVANPSARRSIATDIPSERKSMHDEATMYWSGIAQSASSNAGLHQSESLTQTSSRGRGR